MNSLWHLVYSKLLRDESVNHPESRFEGSTSEPGTAKEIEISYNVHSVSNIDAKTNTYEIDAEVFFFWNEPKAVGRTVGELLHLKKEDMFDPQIYVTNQHELHHHHYETRVLDSTTGDVVCSVHYRGTLYITGMDLRYFPFDCQNLQIGLRTTRLEAEKVMLRPRFPNSLHHHGVHEWFILDHLLKDFLTDPNLSSAHKEYSIMFITVLVKRQSIWFVNNIFIISVLLVMFSWASYIYGPMDHRHKMFVVFCSILSMLENKFVVGNSLPKVQTRTLVDLFVDVSYLCVFVSSASAFITRFVAEEIDMDTAWEVNWILFGINAGLLVAVTLYVIYSVSRVEEDISDWLRHAQAQRLAQSTLNDGDSEELDMAIQHSKGLSRKLKKKVRRGSTVLDFGGGRKAGTSLSKTKGKQRIAKAVYDVKVRLERMGLPTSMKKFNSQPSLSAADLESKRHLASSIITATVRAHAITVSGRSVKAPGPSSPDKPLFEQPAIYVGGGVRGEPTVSAPNTGTSAFAPVTSKVVPLG